MPMKKLLIFLLVCVMATSCGLMSNTTTLTITDTRTNRQKIYELYDMTVTPDSIIAVRKRKGLGPVPFRVPLDAFPYYTFAVNEKGKN